MTVANRLLIAVSAATALSCSPHHGALAFAPGADIIQRIKHSMQAKSKTKNREYRACGFPKIPILQLPKSMQALNTGGMAAVAIGVSFFLDDFSVGSAGNVEGNVVPSLATGMDFTSSHSWSWDSAIQAEVLTDLSHVALDMVTVLGAPSSALTVRVLAVLGRILVMTADYIPDHSIAPDELAFQVLMLNLAFSNLAKSFAKFAWSSFGTTSTMSLRDGRAFSTLFQPFGVTWSQYKAFSSLAFEWVSMEEGEVVQVSTDAVFWLCKGNLTVHGENPPLDYTISRTLPSKESFGKGLLGDLAMLRRLDEIRHSSGPVQNEATEEHEDDSIKIRATAGFGGALMLRINTTRLLSWMQEYDETLEQPIRSLLLAGIQEKLKSPVSTP